MKTRHTLIAISAATALALPGVALAGHSYPQRLKHSAVPPMTTMSGDTTRAEVLDDLKDFRGDPITKNGLYRFVGGERGWVRVRMISDDDHTTRAEVISELRDFRDHPVSADGRYHFVGGELGWIRDYDH